MNTASKLDRGMLMAWVVLIGATIGSWWLGLEEAGGSSPWVSWLSSGLIVLAAFKMRLIGLYFMELRHAPWPLRGAFELWILAVCGGVLGFYHFAPTA